MICIRQIPGVLAVAAAMAWVAPVSAQQAPAAAPAKPAAAPAKPKPAAAPAAKPAAAPAAPAAAAGGATPTLLGQFGDWGAYSAVPGGKKVCFVLAKPGNSASSPANRPRDASYFFISTRPAEKVKEEVSLIIGYPFKPNSDAMVEIGQATFPMYTQNDGAWIKNAAEETRMVEAMRKGNDIVVKGESGRGTKTTDSYSLKGLAQALDRIGQECR